MLKNIVEIQMEKGLYVNTISVEILGFWTKAFLTRYQYYFEKGYWG